MPEGRPKKTVSPGTAPELPLDQGEGDMVEAGTADFFREIAGVKAKIDAFATDLVSELRRDDAAALDFVFVRIDFGFDEGADRLDDHFLFFAQSEIHADPPTVSGRRDGRRLQARPNSHAHRRSP